MERERERERKKERKKEKKKEWKGVKSNKKERSSFACSSIIVFIVRFVLMDVIGN
jgi:hypothetical protein